MKINLIIADFKYGNAYRKNQKNSEQQLATWGESDLFFTPQYRLTAHSQCETVRPEELLPGSRTQNITQLDISDQ